MSWIIDPAHAQVAFSVRHMMLMNVRGRFEKFGGIVEFDEKNPSQTQVDVQIEAASINTNEPQRDGHLRSPDFFNADEYPYMTFKSQRVELLSPEKAHLYGDMTIRDVTRPVVMDVEYLGQSKSPWGKTSAGFSASTKISRKDWNLNWNVALESGGWLVGDEIAINIELELIKQAEPVEELVAVA